MTLQVNRLPQHLNRNDSCPACHRPQIHRRFRQTQFLDSHPSMRPLYLIPPTTQWTGRQSSLREQPRKGYKIVKGGCARSDSFHQNSRLDWRICSRRPSWMSWSTLTIKNHGDNGQQKETNYVNSPGFWGLLLLFCCWRDWVCIVFRM